MMSRARSMGSALGMLVSLFAVACSSPSKTGPSRLPFHVAVVPVQTSLDPTLEEDESLESKLEMQLAIDSQDLSETLARELDAESFTRAVVLPFPADVDRETFETWPSHEQAAWWEQAARAEGADLLLEGTLVYSPYLEVHDNALFWPNFFLFGIGGPFCFFLPDQSYFVDARLRARLIDLSPVYDGRASLRDGRSQLLSIQPELDELSLSFVDRADDVGSYALSIVVPASFVSLDDAGVLEEVRAGVLEGLGRTLVQQVRDGSDSVVLADRLFPFYCDPAELAVQRTSEGGILVRGEVILRLGRGVESMDQYQIQVGDAIELGDFGAGRVDEDSSTPSERFRRYPFDSRFGPEARGDAVRVTVWDASRERNTRSFTVPIASTSE